MQKGDAAHAALQHGAQVHAVNVQAADAGADHHAHAGAVLLLRVQRRILNGLRGGCHGQQFEAVAAPRRFRVFREIGGGVEILYMSGDTGRGFRCIKGIHQTYPGAAFLHGFPGFIHVQAERRHGAHPGDYDSSFCHGCCHLILPCGESQAQTPIRVGARWPFRCVVILRHYERRIRRGGRMRLEKHPVQGGYCMSFSSCALRARTAFTW